MGRKLFVGNLAYGVTDDDLQQLFSQAGTCESASVVTDRDTGQSRGFAFVTMATADDADGARGWTRRTISPRPVTARDVRAAEFRAERPIATGVRRRRATGCGAA